jgi:hypothetical protein
VIIQKGGVTQIGDNTFDWTPPASLPEGSYRMVVQMNIVYSTGGGYSSNDQSDGDFTIGNLVSVTPPPVTPTPTPQYPYVTGCIKSPAYSGDQCSGYRYAASTTLYPGCYANYDQCVNAVAPSDGYKGTCIPVQQTGCNGYRYMPGLSRSCYSLEQCQALGISPTPILPTTVVPTITPTPPRPTVIVPTYTLTPTPIRPTATPTPQITSGACKEGVNSFVVFNPCGNGNYRNATYSCYDGFTSTIGDPTSCKPSLVWQQYAIQNCVGHSSCKTTPTPTKVPIPTPPPIVVKGSCQYGVTSFTPGQSCGNGMSTYATYTCVNNKSGRAGDGVCRPYSQLMLYSYQNCQSQLYCIPTPTPIPWWWRWLPRR